MLLILLADFKPMPLDKVIHLFTRLDEVLYQLGMKIK